ncbi:MAG: FHA domain-containing protein, partial [Kiritimatiellae bacterium]|nr:FHA domain-containing protein [Kiritimatiellia bacterium]
MRQLDGGGIMRTLTIFREGESPVRMELAPGVYVAGSSERCRIRLEAPGVSGRHAIFSVSATGVTVEDMGSDS